MTVLDEFVIKLKLDPKDFDQAQRDAFNKLRGFEQQSKGASEHVAEAMRKGMGAFYEQFTASLDKTSTGLQTIGNKTRRTGEQIYAGGTTGAAGFKHLTSSLLEAYAVVGTLEGAMHKLEQGAQRATSTVIGSLTTGIKPRELGALAGMYLPASYQEVLSAVQTIKSWKADWVAGKFPQQVADAFSRYGGLAGINVDYSKLGSAREMLAQISAIERRLPVAMRGQFLKQLGISTNLLPEMLKPPGQQQRDYLASFKRQPTAGVTEELFKLSNQVKKTEQSWLTLWETIEAAASKSGVMTALKDLDTGLQETNTWFTTTRAGAETLKDGLAVLSVVISVGLVGALTGLLALLNRLTKFTAVMGTIAKLPAWMTGAGAGLYTFFHTGQLNEGAKAQSENLRRMGPPVPGWQWYPSADNGAGSWGPPGLPGAEVQSPNALGTPATAPRNNPGNIRPPGSATGFMSYPDEDTGVQAISSNLQSYANQHGINTLAGVITRWSPPSENDTPTLIANAARRTGYQPNQVIDLNDPDVRAKVAAAIIVQEQGGLPVGVTPDMINAAVRAGSAAPNTNPDTSTIPGMVLTPTPKSGLGSNEGADQSNKPTLGDMIGDQWNALVKRGQAAGLISPSTSPPAAPVSAATTSPAVAPATTPPDANASPTTTPAVVPAPAPPQGPITGLPTRFQHGGIVPAAAGGWVVPTSFGTDTVPAMLTPGEATLPVSLTEFLMAAARAPRARPPAGRGGDTAISIGQIAVHTAATDAGGIARDIRRAVAREMTQRGSVRVMQANTVYE